MASKFRLHPVNTAFIVVDIQEKLMVTMDYREKIYKSHRILMALARQLNIPVIKCEQYPKGLGSTVPEVADLLPEEHFKLEKVSFSAFGQDLQNILQQINPQNIVITGTETHVCVFQTTRDLLEAGYNVHVARDGVCSRFKENYLSGLQLMENMGAVINNTETIAFDLLQRSDTPDFKVVSPIFK
ncbi:isochorismatase [hydrocarbon metagenome]|uniref:Isochorismatase n=1 Tax=hydrocarbon metagenome TaxID=938273 RepID=A0A0W8E520_9ZZZZ